MLQHISAADVAGKLDWTKVVNALSTGHQAARPVLGDQLLESGDNSLLSRSAWINDLGVGVKSVTVMADNAAQNLPTVQGAMLVFDDQTGKVRAIIDSDVVTYWKTAGDSVYGASLLACPDSESLLVIGAGVVGESVVRAYSEVFPSLKRISIWNRTKASAELLTQRLQKEGYPIEAVEDLSSAVESADIISTATMSVDPILAGEWVQPGTHVDLIGAFRPDMREADDQLLQKGRLFVDCRDTTIEHIGELIIPLKSGTIKESEVLADLYDLNTDAFRRTDEDITIFKNGGGAHLDLMVANLIIQVVEECK